MESPPEKLLHQRVPNIFEPPHQHKDTSTAAESNGAATIYVSGALGTYVL